jgi:endoglucanase
MKNYLIFSFLFWICLSVCCTPSLGQKFLKTQGKFIIDSAGNRFVPKGTNLGNWLVPEGYMFKTGDVSSAAMINLLFNEMVGPDQARKFWDGYLDNYITKEDIRYIASLGLNHIRLPFNYRLLTDEDYLGRNYHGFEYLDKTVEWCREAGIYVLFDMHCAPCGQTGDNIDDSYGYPFLFTDAVCQDQFIEIWTRIAERYSNDPVVMGYDLLNEPIATLFGKDIPVLNKELEPLYKRAVQAIRKVDPNHIIVLGGAQWNNNFKIFGTPFDKNLLYEFHKYWFEVKPEAIQEYVDFRDKFNVPVYMGESGENTDDWVLSFRVLLDKSGIGWCFWPYKKMDNTKGILNFKQPVDWPLITQFAAANRATFKDVRDNMPDRQKAAQALKEFLDFCQYKNCFPNDGYIKALTDK